MQPKGWQGSQKKQNSMRNFVIKLKFMVWFNMEAIPKSDILSDLVTDLISGYDRLHE